MEFTREQKIQMYKEKQNFVKELSGVIPFYIPSVIGLQYKVFENKKEGCFEEYLVIGFDGGARLARCCNINSNMVILSEIGKYVRGGYYDEVKDLVRLETDPDWVEI
jgi:hypothetical protein